MTVPRVLAIAHTADARLRVERLLEGIPGALVRGPFAGVSGVAGAFVVVLRSGAGVLYLVDVGKSTVPLAVLGRLLRKRVVVDTGDASYALARSLGERGFASSDPGRGRREDRSAQRR